MRQGTDMGFTSINDAVQRAQVARPEGERRKYLNPPDLLNHLLLVWPIRYEQNTVTKYKRENGMPSDAVYVDIVDLSVKDDLGYPGFVMRQAKWTQGRLIRDTKGAVGVDREQPMLVQITKDGDAYQLIEQAQNPASVQMAEWWMTNHPDFFPGDDAPQRMTVEEPPQSGPIRETPPYSGNYPMPQSEPSGVWPPTSGAPSVPAAPVEDATRRSLEQSAMDRLRRQAQGAPLPPPPPPAPSFPNEEPPF